MDEDTPRGCRGDDDSAATARAWRVHNPVPLQAPCCRINPSTPTLHYDVLSSPNPLIHSFSPWPTSYLSSSLSCSEPAQTWLTSSFPQSKNPPQYVQLLLTRLSHSSDRSVLLAHSVLDFSLLLQMKKHTPDSPFYGVVGWSDHC